MSDKEEILQTLRNVGAVIADSHIVYTSGKHGSAYVNKDAIYPHTEKTSYLCTLIAKQFMDDRVEVVIAPAIGGVILSQWTAYHLIGNGYAPISTYAEKEVYNPHPLHAEKCYRETGNFIIKRGYDKLVAGKNVLVVEDILTTGGSVKKVTEAVRAIGGFVVGVGALCNRGGITASDIGAPKLVSLVDIALDAWDEEDCPLCKQGVPINTDVGKGREFLARR